MPGPCSYAVMGRSAALEIEVFRNLDDAQRWLTAQANAREKRRGVMMPEREIGARVSRLALALCVTAPHSLPYEQRVSIEISVVTPPLTTRPFVRVWHERVLD